MKLHILGSGTFFVDKNISASSFVLDTGKKKLLIDCGPGTLAKLSQAGFKPDDIDYVFLTHFHPDHSSDLFPFFMNFKLSDAFAPGEIRKYPTFFGPEGINDFLINYSKLVELPAYESYGKIKVLEYKSEMKIEDFILKPFKVIHNSFGIPAKAYSLRFEINGKVITFSGDSAKCSALEEACKDANLFICDSSYPNIRQDQIHVNTEEIGQICQKSKVKKLILDHFYPQFSKYDLVKEVKENYKGEVIRAKDLDIIDI